MLIRDAIERAKIAGTLIAARPSVPWAPEPRVFLKCRPLQTEIEAGSSDPNEKVRQRWARLEAMIGSFVEGNLVNDDVMKQLQPYKYEHWEMRSRKPSPSLRVFGRFAMPDVFVGTHVERRDGLGGMWSAQFEHQKLVCEDHWKAAGLADVFTDAPMFRYEAYLTSNAYRKLRVSR